MSRKKDIDFLKVEIELVTDQQVKVATKFEEFKLSLNGAIRLLMKRAGILDEFLNLEKEIEARKEQDQKKVDELESKIKELNSILNFLEKRQTEDERAGLPGSKKL